VSAGVAWVSGWRLTEGLVWSGRRTRLPVRHQGAVEATQIRLQQRDGAHRVAVLLGLARAQHVVEAKHSVCTHDELQGVRGGGLRVVPQTKDVSQVYARRAPAKVPIPFVRPFPMLRLDSHSHTIMK
jgi:hypothetical protein